MEKINRALWSWLSAGPSLNWVTSREETWAGTWMTRIESQPFEDNFWSKGITVPKYKQALMARSQQWGGGWERQGPGHMESCRLWLKVSDGNTGQSVPEKGAALSLPQRGLAACLPSQFCGRCSFFFQLLSYCPGSPLVIFIQSKLYMWFFGDLCNSWSSLVTRRGGKCSSIHLNYSFQFWWFAKPVFLFDNRLSFE